MHFSHHKITFKRKKAENILSRGEWLERAAKFKGQGYAEKVAMSKSHIGSLLYNTMECHQPLQPPLRNVHQQATSSLSEVENDSHSDIIDRIVGSNPSASSDESSPETDFLPEPGAETLPTSKYGRKRARVERDNYFSGDKIFF